MSRLTYHFGFRPLTNHFLRQGGFFKTVDSIAQLRPDIFAVRIIAIGRPWPEETTQSILSATRDHMHVQARDALADTIVNRDKSAVGAKRVFDCPAKQACGREQRTN